MKRPRDMFDTPASSLSPPMPAKRRFLSQPIDPSSSPSTSHSTPYTLPCHPLSSPWAFATPHDSPSNPFGLNRALRALALPRPSGFGKHLVLRMQLVSTADAPPRTRPSRRYVDAPFRIVQVPLNYSFRLLHMLVLFLFASDARLQVKRRRRVFSPPSPVARRTRDKGKMGDQGQDRDGEEGEGHLFEVLNGISVCSLAGQRPGQIRAGTGKLYARLSSARERKLFPDDNDEDEDEDEDEDKKRVGPPYLVKLIDFAHTKIVPGIGPDEGVLKGVDTVLSLLDGRIEQARAVIASKAADPESSVKG